MVPPPSGLGPQTSAPADAFLAGVFAHCAGVNFAAKLLGVFANLHAVDSVRVRLSVWRIIEDCSYVDLPWRLGSTVRFFF